MKKFKKLILVLIIISMGIFVACGNVDPTEETKPEPTMQVALEIPEDSILYFNDNEGSEKLIQFFAEGNIPEEVYFLYDQMGSNPEITVTDAETIQELYHLLSMITVTGKTNESVTDCYHHIGFKLADDSCVKYSFEGNKMWCYSKENYSIENSNKLFALMEDLTEEYLNQKGCA